MTASLTNKAIDYEWLLKNEDIKVVVGKVIDVVDSFWGDT